MISNVGLQSNSLAADLNRLITQIDKDFKEIKGDVVERNKEHYQFICNKVERVFSQYEIMTKAKKNRLRTLDDPKLAMTHQSFELEYGNIR